MKFKLLLFGNKQSWQQKWLLLIFLLFHAVTASNPELSSNAENDAELLSLNKSNDNEENIGKTTDSPVGFDNNINEYRSMKRAFDIFNEKMEFYMSFYTNELTLLTTVLSEYKEKIRTVENIHAKVDQIIERQNEFELKLSSMSEKIADSHGLATSQSVVHKLDHIEHSLQYLRERIDDSKSNDKQHRFDEQTKWAEQSQTSNANNGEQQLNNCEYKIDHLISFVHNFAELDRLESSDVLNRLGNMQSQLIQFFDVKAETIQRPKQNEFDLVHKTKVKNTALDSGNVTGIERLANGNISDGMNKPLFERLKRGKTRIKRSELNCNECERKLRNCQLQCAPFPIHPNNDVDVDLDILQSHKTSRAKYGAPSPYGCHQFVNISRPDGIYRFQTIQTMEAASAQIADERKCSFDTNGVAWTVIQSRGLENNNSLVSLNFNRSWNDYKNGFGQLNGEFWFGNEFIHRLTYDDDMELKVELESWDNRRMEFVYDIFRVDSEANRYNLFISGFRGEDKRLDAFKYHNNQDFSTFDRQNDKTGIDDRQACCSCAKSYASGWWFNNCIEVNLNGVRQQSPYNNNYVGIIWEPWLGDYSLKSSKLLIRPKIGWPAGDENDPNSKPPEDP